MTCTQSTSCWLYSVYSMASHASEESTHRVVIDGLSATDALEVQEHILEETGIKQEAVRVE